MIFEVLVGLGFVIVAWALVASAAANRELARRVLLLEQRPLPPPPESRPQLAQFRPLEGMRVALVFDQDHPHRPFETLLREALFREDALVVESGETLRLEGRIVSNGYADVYFDAEIKAFANGVPALTLIERPPHGDRPGNLVLELIDRLNAELTKRQARDERQSALRELGT